MIVPAFGPEEMGDGHAFRVAQGVLSKVLHHDEYAWDTEEILHLMDTGLEMGLFGTDAVVELIQQSQQLLARTQALQLKAVAELGKRRGDERDTADEVAFAMAVSTRVADRQVELAQQLDARYPKTLAAMGRGELDSYKASRIVDTGRPLTDEHAGQLDEFMATRTAGRDASAIQQSARYRVNVLDPDGAALRAERRKKDRRVEFSPADDAMAWLSGYLPADVAAAAYSRIDAIAKSNRTRGDERSMDEARADVFTDILLGKDLSHRTVQVHVTVPVSTLLGTTDLPAALDGYGWIPAEQVRQMIDNPDSTLRRLLTDPATGQLMEVGRHRYATRRSLRVSCGQAPRVM